MDHVRLTHKVIPDISRLPAIWHVSVGYLQEDLSFVCCWEGWRIKSRSPSSALSLRELEMESLLSVLLSAVTAPSSSSTGERLTPDRRVLMEDFAASVTVLNQQVKESKEQSGDRDSKRERSRSRAPHATEGAGSSTAKFPSTSITVSWTIIVASSPFSITMERDEPFNVSFARAKVSEDELN